VDDLSLRFPFRIFLRKCCGPVLLGSVPIRLGTRGLSFPLFERLNCSLAAFVLLDLFFSVCVRHAGVIPTPAGSTRLPLK
jgi:hypothetical protein